MVLPIFVSDANYTSAATGSSNSNDSGNISARNCGDRSSVLPNSSNTRTNAEAIAVSALLSGFTSQPPIDSNTTDNSDTLSTYKSELQDTAATRISIRMTPSAKSELKRFFSSILVHEIHGADDPDTDDELAGAIQRRTKRTDRIKGRKLKEMADKCDFSNKESIDECFPIYKGESKGNLTVPRELLDRCSTPLAKALEVLKWRDLSKKKQLELKAGLKDAREKEKACQKVQADRAKAAARREKKKQREIATAEAKAAKESVG